MTEPSDIEAHLQAGRYAEAARAARQAGQLERAQGLFEKIWDFAAAAECAREAGDLPGALRNLIDARDVDGQQALASLLPAAQENVRRAAARVYEGRRMWSEAATLCEALGDTEHALELFQKGGLFASAARLCEERGAWREAGRLYERSLEEEPDGDARAAHLGLARILARVGQGEAAVKHLQEASRRAEGAPRVQAEILRLLALELWALGLAEAAREAARRAHDLDPASPLDPRALVKTAPPPAKGETVLCGRYRLGEVLGSGMTGRVILALDELSGKQVAVKVFVASQAADHHAYERFVREARLFAHVKHPHIVDVLAFHEDLGFFVMEYMSGGTLADRLRPRLAAPAVKRLALELLAALEFAHQHGVVHRDLKPKNILFDAQGKAKLGDFGVAHLLDLGQTQTGGLIGTLAYMSPEQITGSPLSFAADLYSLGVTLFQALTGRLPFLGPDFVAEHLGARAPRASEVWSEVGVAWDALLGRLLEKDPAARHGSSSELERELETLATEDPPPLLILPRQTLPSSAEPKVSDEARLSLVTAEPQPIPQSPQQDRYQAEVPLGDTPVSRLYRGVDLVLARSVVIERFHEGHPDANEQRRLLGLAAALGPHLQHVLAYDRAHRTVVYQAPVGQPFASWPASLAPPDMARLLIALGAALTPVHRAGIAHGSVDEGHVLFDESGTATLLVAGLGRGHDDPRRDVEDCLRLALLRRDIADPSASAELLHLATPSVLVPAAEELSRMPLDDAQDLRRFADRLASELDRADRAARHIQALVEEVGTSGHANVLARIRELALGHGLPEARVRALVPSP
jgi:serine/threonine-protein kinase